MKALILGGVKSGKSRRAEALASSYQQSFPDLQLCMLATAQALDEEMHQRIEQHKKDRGSEWETIESPINLSNALLNLPTGKYVIVIDCLTLWLTNLLMLEDEVLMNEEIDSFVACLEQINDPLVLVSNETNMGVMPMGELSRRYCDAAGLLHQRLAKVCDTVELVIAGLPMTLKTA